MKNKVFSELDKLEEQYLCLLEELCNIESPSSSKVGVDAACRRLCSAAQRLGFEIELLPQSVSGDAAAITMNASADGSMIALSAHLDTVHPIGSFGSPPTRREGELMLGPGVVDCKGGAVAALFAMDALRRGGFKGRPVRLILQTDEEVGSRPSRGETIAFMCEKSKGARAFLNLEGHLGGTACVARKGILCFTFTVTGKAAHSSHCASEGANAIAEAAHKIIELEKLKDESGLTCCCSVISGGTAANTVPASCTFKADVRFATAEQEAFAREYAERVAKTTHVEGCTCSVTKPKGRPAMERVERNLELLDALNEAFEKCALPKLAPATRTGGSDAAYVTKFGTPCLDSLGTEGGEIHTTNEFMRLASLKESAQRIVAAVLYL